MSDERRKSVPPLLLSNSPLLVNKNDELSSIVSNLLADNVVITETWLTPNVDSAVINLNGFSTFRRDREDGRRGGGVCVYVKNCLPVIHLTDLSNPELESLWLLIKPRRLPRSINSIILKALYHPPNRDDRAMSSYLTECFDRALTGNPGTTGILTGDFNQLKQRQLCNSFSLKQIVKIPTGGSNILGKSIQIHFKIL